MNSNELLHALRKFVLTKSGLRNIDPGHCKNISEYIFRDTKNYISETTIKRFFGFASTQHKFSLFTLNSLSQYIGYKDWSAFSKENEVHEKAVDSVWDDLKLRAHSITNTSLIVKKNNSGIPFESTSKRSFFYPDFEYFLTQNYQFTTISSPPGQGKSILLAHMVEHFFYSEDAIYKNDIVLLINSATIRSIIQSGLSIQDWFYNELKFRSLSELFNYLNEHPTECNGRFVFIIDGIDEFLAISAYQKIFVDFLHSIEENVFFKMVLGLRTNSWANLQPIISESAFLTKGWYNGLFFDLENQSNIPALSIEEILHSLTQIEETEIKQHDVSERLLKQFQIPFWLQVYYKLKQEKRNLDLKNPVLCYELVNYFLDQKVFLAQKSTEKIFLLKRIAETISHGKKGLRVAKEHLLNEITQHQTAYYELLYSGILIEEKRLSTTMPTEVIRFLNYDLYTYFIFIQIAEQFKYKINYDVFKFILKKYRQEVLTRGYILNWVIRFCISRNQGTELKSIFSLPFSNEEKNSAFNFICNFVQHELTKPNTKFVIDLNFIDILVTSKIVGNNYKKTIKHIGERTLETDVQILVSVIECNISIIDLDKSALNNSMQFLKRNYKRASELFPINPYDLALFFYNNLTNKTTTDNTLNTQILKLSKALYIDEPKDKNISSIEILTYRMILVFLFTKKNYAECHRFAMAILNKYPKIFFNRHSVFSSFLLILLGQTYLKLQYIKKAQKIILFLDKIISLNYTYHTNYIDAGYYALKANFYTENRLYDDAIININAGIKIALEHNFKMVIVSLLLIKIDILRHLGPEENVSETIKQLLNFLNENHIDMPGYANIIGSEFDNTFNVLKSFKKR